MEEGFDPGQAPESEESGQAASTLNPEREEPPQRVPELTPKREESGQTAPKLILEREESPQTVPKLTPVDEESPQTVPQLTPQREESHQTVPQLTPKREESSQAAPKLILECEDSPETIPKPTPEHEESLQTVTHLPAQREESLQTVPQLSPQREESTQTDPQLTPKREESGQAAPKLTQECKESPQTVPQSTPEGEESEQADPKLALEREESPETLPKLDPNLEATRRMGPVHAKLRLDIPVFPSVLKRSPRFFRLEEVGEESDVNKNTSNLAEASGLQQPTEDTWKETSSESGSDVTLTSQDDEAFTKRSISTPLEEKNEKLEQLSQLNLQVAEGERNEALCEEKATEKSHFIYETEDFEEYKDFLFTEGEVAAHAELLQRENERRLLSDKPSAPEAHKHCEACTVLAKFRVERRVIHPDGAGQSSDTEGAADVFRMRYFSPEGDVATSRGQEEDLQQEDGQCEKYLVDIAAIQEMFPEIKQLCSGKRCVVLDSSGKFRELYERNVEEIEQRFPENAREHLLSIVRVDDLNLKGSDESGLEEDEIATTGGHIGVLLSTATEEEKRAMLDKQTKRSPAGQKTVKFNESVEAHQSDGDCEAMSLADEYDEVEEECTSDSSADEQDGTNSFKDGKNQACGGVEPSAAVNPNLENVTTDEEEEEGAVGGVEFFKDGEDQACSGVRPSGAENPNLENVITDEEAEEGAVGGFEFLDYQKDDDEDDSDDDIHFSAYDSHDKDNDGFLDGIISYEDVEDQACGGSEPSEKTTTDKEKEQKDAGGLKVTEEDGCAFDSSSSDDEDERVCNLKVPKERYRRARRPAGAPRTSAPSSPATSSPSAALPTDESSSYIESMVNTTGTRKKRASASQSALPSTSSSPMVPGPVPSASALSPPLVSDQSATFAATSVLQLCLILFLLHLFHWLQWCLPKLLLLHLLMLLRWCLALFLLNLLHLLRWCLMNVLLLNFIHLLDGA